MIVYLFLGKQEVEKHTPWKVWTMTMLSEELFPELVQKYFRKPVVLLRRYCNIHYDWNQRGKKPIYTKTTIE